MIPRAAVEQYLNRPLDSHIWVKGLTREELDEALAGLRPKPRLSSSLRLHQRACFLLGVAYPQFAYWLDMGTGKSLLTLELMRYWTQAGKLDRALILVTSDKAFPTWEKQFIRWKIDLPFVMLEGSSEQKWRQLDEFGGGIVFVSYPGVVAMVSHLVQVKGKRKQKMVLDPLLIKRLRHRLGAVVLDESTRAANRDNLAHKLIVQLRKTASICYALSGRPFGRDPTMLWGQHLLIDGGETLGETLGLFRAAFFSEEKNPYDKRGYARDYTFKRRLQPKLSKMVQHRSITYTADECIDLPPFTPIIEEVRFTEEIWTYYDRLKASVRAARGNLRAMENIFLRMRQLSSGFLGFKDDETGEKAQVEFGENPKFDRLLELIDEMPPQRKAVVFYEFTYSGRKVVEAIEEQFDFKPIWLWSGTKNTKAEMERFTNDPDCAVAVVNNKLGAYSLDGLQVANYTFFYESPVPVIDREQAERRVRRDGQLHRVFQYDILVRGSVDQRILEFHKEGEDLFRVLLKDPARALGL